MRVTKPHRVRRAYQQTIHAAPERIFPLLCPVRETEWTRGWAPRQVWSETGLVEQDCAFVTPGDPTDTVWFVSRHDTDNFALEMIMVTPGRTVSKLEVQLTATTMGTTLVEFAYAHTSLGPAGDTFLESFTQESYERTMRLWEKELNHFLEQGHMLPPTREAPRGISS